MELKEHLTDIQNKLKLGRFSNEAQVSQGVVLRILQALEWPVFDSQTVWPEYSVDGRRVDYALCDPQIKKPLVFLEVKQVGKSEGADKQLFEYAFIRGVQMAVLTDGQEWHFYLPGESGTYQERRVYLLDLLERDIEECDKRLKRYLSWQGVKSGQCIKFAREDYNHITINRDIKRLMPDAWNSLVKEDDPTLIDLIAEKVETLCGYKPRIETVSHFLSKMLFGEQSGYSKPNSPPDLKNIGKEHHPHQEEKKKDYSFDLQGQNFKYRSSIDVLIQVVEKLSSQDEEFCERFVARPKHSRKRRYIARDKYDLYPGRRDLCENNSRQIKSGYWVGTNYNKSQIKQILEMACEVAGLKFGVDLKVDLGE